jgi:hypothetical protein
MARPRVRKGAVLTPVIQRLRQGDSPALLRLEDLVHDLGAGRDDRAQFAAVDDLGGAGTGVTSRL